MIGAGLSGLTAAATLREAGASVLVIEASTMIGGRIQALREPEDNRALADLGPTWVWRKYQPVAARWLEQLGVDTFDQFNDGDAILEGYAPTLTRQPLPGQEGMVRMIGGPSALIDALADSIGFANIRVSAKAVEISEQGKPHTSVLLSTGEILTARRVIIAVPLRVAATTLRLPWASPALMSAMRATPTWMSTHAKAVALYNRPFWRDAGLSGRIASRLGPLIEVHDHSGINGTPAALFGFVGWPPERRASDPEGLRKAILGQLSACLGDEAAHPLELVIQDWATKPEIVTKQDLSQPSDHPDMGPAVLRQPYLDGRVLFAVSEVSNTSPGLLEGALAIGEQVALHLIDDVKHRWGT